MNDLLQVAKKYQKKNLKKGLLDLLTSLPLYAASFVAAVVIFEISKLLYVLVLVLVGLLLLRTFVVFHDLAHESLFASTKANHFWGHILSLFFLTPYYVWQTDHNKHHKHSGNLDATTIGELPVFTVQQYRDASLVKKIYYRLYRNPCIMLLIGPIWVFFLMYRIPKISRSTRENMNIVAYDIVLGLFVFICISVNAWVVMLTYFLSVFLTASIGIYFFYAQHNYRTMYWETEEHWNFVEAGMKGASFWDLPVVMRWFTLNIGYHHAHHLHPGIPNYQLREFHYTELAAYDCVHRMTFLESLQIYRLKLWDEKRQELVTFKEAGF